MNFHFFNRLSNRLFFVVLSTALAMGLLISSIQIFLDVRYAQEDIKKQAHQLLAMMKDPATQSAYNIDRSMAEQVVEGLFQNEAVFYAAIKTEIEPSLASNKRPLKEFKYRELSNMIFGQSLYFSLPLNGTIKTRLSNRADYFTATAHYGVLEINIDPAYATQALTEQASQIIYSGILQSTSFGIVLTLIFHVMITLPMTRMTKSLESIDPLRPSSVQLEAPKGHKSDEMGLWINKINELFAAIESNSNKRQAAEAHVERLSHYDVLTELPNRVLLNKRIEQTIVDADQQNEIFSILWCGLDDFNSVNMLHSYNAGNHLLLSLSERLQQEMQTIQTISRVGGDIFALVLPNISSHLDAAKIAQRVLEVVRSPFQIDDTPVSITASIGISVYPHDGTTPDELLKHAENVVQLAKAQGGNRYQFFVESIDQKIKDTKRLEKSLSVALEQNQFSLLFQPQMNLKTMHISGVEALVRWHHPEHGLVPPADFIPLAENNQSIIAIGKWIIDESCKALSLWHEAGHPQLTMSINVSATQLHQSNLIPVIKKTLQKYNLNPNKIILEITETAVMSNLEAAIKMLKHIKKLGIQIAIDDFGTGYASLNHLKRLPFDKVKVDKTFIDDMLDSPENATIVGAIIKLGHNLNMEVIAEGTETLEQIDFLKKAHCDYAQGYYYSRPVNKNEILSMMEKAEPVTTTPSNLYPLNPER
ncbi:MAG: GGDEF-domain containing protein [Moraxellaceae bacterium]|nr:MAG: GGDEF-domain containing protein [Moraxellaceae bacterium]